MIGASMAFTGMLFSESILMVSNLFAMVAVRGSNSRLVFSDNVVTDIFTPISRSLASSLKRSRSLKIKVFFVIIPTGCLYFKNISKHALVISNLFSAG